jgi:hypothetical protein
MPLSEDERFERDLRYQPWTLLFFFPVLVIIPGGIGCMFFFFDGGHTEEWMLWAMLAALSITALLIIYFMERREIWFTQNKKPAWLMLYGFGSILALACAWTIFESRGVTFGDRCKTGGVLCGLIIAGFHLKPMLKGR